MARRERSEHIGKGCPTLHVNTRPTYLTHATDTTS